MGWPVIGDIVTAIGNVVAAPIKSWGERKKIETEAKTQAMIIDAEARVEAAKARVELAKTGQMIEADWDVNAQKDMKYSIKDELMLVIIVAPFVCSFLPWTQDYVIKGWEYIARAPYWYTVSFLGIIAAVFGLRWLVAPVVKTIKRK